MKARYKSKLIQLHNQLNLYEEDGNSLAYAETAKKIAKVYEKLLDNGEAIDWYLKALQSSLETNNKRTVWELSIKLGQLHIASMLFKKALEHFRRAERYAANNNEKLEAQLHIGNVYNWMADPSKPDWKPELLDKPAKIFENCLKRAQGNKNVQMRVTYFLAIARNKQRRYDEALQLFEKSLQLVPKKDTTRKSDILKSMGVSCFRMQDYNKALTYFKEAEQYMPHSKNKLLELLIYGNTTMCYEAMGDYKMAYTYHRKFSEAQDAINQEKISYKVTAIEVNNEVIQTQKEKQALEQKNQELAEKNEIIFQEKQKSEQLLVKVTDSIRYASLIQSAILPSDESWHIALPNSFVLYMPKDIVSGDFYWMEQFGDDVFFAAVDCTGHGVPGAMMSMVGYNGLNQAVGEHRLRDTAVILNYLSLSVKEALRKHEKEDHVKDGMDIALCRLNKKTMELQFSGAYNSLLHIRDGVMDQIKGEPLAIGAMETYGKKYIRHDIQLKKGDAIYIFSDGYADQFGGDWGKKMKSAVMRQRILEIQDYPIHEQKKLLKEHLENWRGDHEQVDDVCVIGVKI